MDANKQYEIIDSDGTAAGFFLDGRLYEYLTSTCIGYLDGNGNVIDGENKLGSLDGDTYRQSDGRVYRLLLKESPTSSD